MIATRRATAAWTLAALTGTSAAQTSARHLYRFALGDANATVTVEVRGASGAALRVQMPAWRPGFRPGVIPGNPPPGWRLTASSGGKPLTIVPRGKGDWAVATGGAKELTLRYELPIVGRNLAHGIGQRYPHEFRKDGKPATVRYHEALLLRAGAIWLDIAGAEHEVAFDVPGTFTPVGPGGRGSYETLVATPVFLGRATQMAFAVADHKHTIQLAGFERDRTDRTQFRAWLSSLVRQNRRALGAPRQPTFRFLIGRRTGVPSGVGYRASAEILTPTLRPSAALARHVVRAHLAHWDGAYFHPDARDGLADPTMTEAAWFWLGAREYLTELAVVRAGGEKPEAFWTRTVAAQINVLQLDEKRLLHAVAATGNRMMRPERVPAPPAPHPRVVGFLLCLLLDAEIRASTAGKQTFDAAVRAIESQCTSRKKGYTNADIQAVCEKLAGRKLTELFACVTAARELPLSGTLAKIGVEALPIARPQPKDPKDKRLPKPRRRPPRWRVQLVLKPGEDVVQIREGITNGD